VVNALSVVSVGGAGPEAGEGGEGRVEAAEAGGVETRAGTCRLPTARAKPELPLIPRAGEEEGVEAAGA